MQHSWREWRRALLDLLLAYLGLVLSGLVLGNVVLPGLQELFIASLRGASLAVGLVRATGLECELLLTLGGIYTFARLLSRSHDTLFGS